MNDVLFLEIAIVIVTAGVLSLIASLLKQPLIIAYIVTGLVVGPSLLGVADSSEVFQALSEIGVAFLLFLVGINLNWRHVRDVGGVALAGGFGQVIFTAIIGYGIGRLFGYDTWTAFFLATGFAFSSTIVIVKLLTDKEDLDRLYGKLSVGILIVQDLIAMALLLIAAALRGGGSIETIVVASLLKLGAVVIVLWLLVRFILPPVFRYAARSQELLFLAAIAWCFAIASSLYLIGFGVEIGALLAGISLAGSKYHRDIEVKVRPLRDFFLVIFFIVLGTHLSFEGFETTVFQGLAYSAFILIGNPLILLTVLRIIGYHPRTGFMTGVAMAQISEFSFIFIASGIAAGLVDPNVMPLTTIVGLFTIALSTYMVNDNEQLYERLRFLFRLIEGDKVDRESALQKAPSILILGNHRISKGILPVVQEMKKDYLIVDFDPAVIRMLEDRGIPHTYGDAGDEGFLRMIRAERATLVISTIPDEAVNEDVLCYLRQANSKATVIVTSKTTEGAKKMYDLGAHFVIVPSLLGGERFAELLKQKKGRKSSWNTAAKKLLAI